jgi:cell volume regulation protein A
VLREGDRVIILTRTFDDTETFLIEKRIKPDSRRVGSRISDYPGTGLIVSVQRGDETIIPHGSTVLAAGDKLTILNIK